MNGNDVYVLIAFILIIILVIMHCRRAGAIVGGAAAGLMLSSPSQSILIVDLANAASKWHGDKYKRQMGGMDQDNVFKKYAECMKDHHAQLGIYHDSTIYVVKNHKYGKGNRVEAPKLSDAAWSIMRNTINANGLQIVVVEDYTTYDIKTWKTPSCHYLRGADDYMCFYLAHEHKKLASSSSVCIISDDKYSDFTELSKTPPFKATYLRFGEPDKIITVTPEKNKLGMINKYCVLRSSPIRSLLSV